MGSNGRDEKNKMSKEPMVHYGIIQQDEMGMINCIQQMFHHHATPGYVEKS